MNLPYRFLCASLLAAGAAASAAQTARLQPAQSEVIFVTKQMGVPVEGKFRTFDATLELDPKKPESGSASVQIMMVSALLGVPEADTELPKSTWFDSARFPEATFRSTAIKGLGNGKFVVNGKLTIKNIVRDLVVPVTITQSGGTSIATGNFTVKRLDFTIGQGEWTDTAVVANDVVVKFKLAFTGLPPL